MLTLTVFRTNKTLLKQKHFFKLRSILSFHFSFRYLSSKNSKIYPNCLSAIKASSLKSGDTLLVGGFGVCGLPIGLSHAIADLPINNLTLVSNNCGLEKYGIGLMLNKKQIKRMKSSYVGENQEFANQYLNGELEVEFIPQGTLAERLRAGGSGIHAFYTKTGVGTWITEGKVPIKYSKDGSDIEIYSSPKEIRVFNDVKYTLEYGIKGDVSIIKAHQVDEFGNCVFRGTSRNFNPECAKAGKFTIVEAEEIVPLGYFKPENIHLSGAYINGIVKYNCDKRIEILKLSDPNISSDSSGIDFSKLNERQKSRYRIVKRAAQEFSDGMVINLGIGMPTTIPNFVSKDIKIWLQSENGILGMGRYPYPGEEDADLINAGKETITPIDGSSIFSSSESFGMIRGGHVDMSILGSMEVSKYGDIANWMVPGMFVKGMGGAMDLVSSGSEVIVTMEHTDKNNNPKILDKCNLPLTGEKCVSKIITDLCVFNILPNSNGLELKELLDGVEIEEIKAKTGCDFKICPNLKKVTIL